MSNQEKKGMYLKEIIISAGALAIIAGGVTAALAGTNAVTENTIAEINAKAEKEARQQVIQADSFDELTFSDNGEEIVYYAAKKDGNPVGYVFTVSATGKSSGLMVMTGISTDGKITGVKVTDDNETAGYVDKVTKAGLLNQFQGKSDKTYALGQNVDGVSQATKTSKGITHGVDQAVKYFNEHVKEGQ